MNCGLKSAILFSAMFLAGCCNSNSIEPDPNRGGATESGVFEEFQYQENYAAIVELAEAGDKKSIYRLVHYYSTFGKTDLRNLEYWSLKAYNIDGPEELTNLIIALVLRNKCERSWVIVRNIYPDPKSFEFYGTDGKYETLYGNCKRQIQND